MSNKSNKINMADTYQTRDGRKVRVLCIDVKEWERPVIALLENKDGRESLHEFYPDGKRFTASESSDDLILVPKFSAGDIWLCRDCKTKAEILKTDLKGEWPIAGVAKSTDESEELHKWKKDGYFLRCGEYPLDLITKL